MSDTTIDEILDLIAPIAVPNYNMGLLPDEEGYKPEYVEMRHNSEQRRQEAKSALYDLMLSVIGEDEKLKPDENGKYNLMRLTEHQLRAEQRTKLKELMK